MVSKMKQENNRILAAGLGILVAGFFGINSINYSATSTNNIRTRVDVEEYKIAKKGKLFPGGLGSCSVICLYDKKNKIGAMMHFPLGFSDSSRADRLSLDKVLEKMTKNGAQAENIESISLRYGRANETGYIIDYMKNGKIKNRDLPKHSGEIKSLDFDAEKGILEFYRGNSRERYSFSK